MEAKGTPARPPRRRLRPVSAAESVAVSAAVHPPPAAVDRVGQGDADDAPRLACALDALARAIGDCPEEAVAAMVMNRLGAGGRETLAEVLDGLLAGLGAGPAVTATGHGGLAFAARLRIARRALAGVLDDPTRGATRCRLLVDLPGGVSDGLPGGLRIGGLVFYKGD